MVVIILVTTIPLCKYLNITKVYKNLQKYEKNHPYTPKAF